MKRLLAIAFLVAACGGATAPSLAEVSATPPPASTVEPTATPTPAPTPVDPTVPASHLVDALAQLATLSAAGADLNEWGLSEGTWLSTHLNNTDLSRLPAFKAYIDAMAVFVQALIDNADTTAPVAAVLATRNDLAALAGMPAITPTPTTTPNRVGERITLHSGDGTADFAVTIESVKPWSQQYNSPDAGMKYVTTDILLQGVSGSTTVDALDFQMTDAAGYVYTAAGMYREPSLPYHSDLAAGKKIRGWMTWQIPKTMKSGWITYADALIAFTVK